MLTAILLTATALQAATPVPPTTPAAEKKVVREIIIRDGKGERTVTIPEGAGERRIVILEDGQPGKAGERKEIRIVRAGGPGTPVAGLGGCAGGRKFETDADTRDKDKVSKTRILICAKGSETDVAWVQRLRDTAKRIEGDPKLSAETKTRVVAALNSAIAQADARE